MWFGYSSCRHFRASSATRAAAAASSGAVASGCEAESAAPAVALPMVPKAKTVMKNSDRWRMARSIRERVRALQSASGERGRLVADSAQVCSGESPCELAEQRRAQHFPVRRVVCPEPELERDGACIDLGEETTGDGLLVGVLLRDLERQLAGGFDVSIPSDANRYDQRPGSEAGLGVQVEGDLARGHAVWNHDETPRRTAQRGVAQRDQLDHAHFRTGRRRHLQR